MKYTEALSREEMRRFVRFYLLRSGTLRLQIFILVLISGFGVGALVSGERILAGIFVFLVTAGLIGGIWRTLAEFRTFRIYSQSQYPQEYEFSDEGFSVQNANGVFIKIPWRLVQRIYVGHEYAYLKTTAGNYWLHKQRLGGQFELVQKLWRNSKKNRTDGQVSQ